jgi:hypothetical protein
LIEFSVTGNVPPDKNKIVGPDAEAEATNAAAANATTAIAEMSMIVKRFIFPPIRQ